MVTGFSRTHTHCLVKQHLLTKEHPPPTFGPLFRPVESRLMDMLVNSKYYLRAFLKCKSFTHMHAM